MTVRSTLLPEYTIPEQLAELLHGRSFVSLLNERFDWEAR